MADGTSGTTPARTAPHPEWEERFLAALEGYPNITAAAMKAGVGRTTVYRHQHKSPEFARALDAARRVGIGVLEDVLLQRSVFGWKEPVFGRGPGNLTIKVGEKQVFDNRLALAILGRFKPEYRPTARFEHTGEGGGPIAIQSVADLAKLADEAENYVLEAEFSEVPSTADEPLAALPEPEPDE